MGVLVDRGKRRAGRDLGPFLCRGDGWYLALLVAHPLLVRCEIHLLISVIVAPFLFLHSTGSNRTALEGFKRYDNNKIRVSLKSARGMGFLWAEVGIASGIFSRSVFEKIKATLCHLPEI